MAHIIDGPNHEFASRVIDLRRKKNFTQEELGVAVGVDKRSISMYENGRTFPREETINSLAKVFDVDPYWLAKGTSKQLADFIANQFTDILNPNVIKVCELLYIEDWANLKPDFSQIEKITYSDSPRYTQSSDLSKFVPVIKPRLAPYRASRYPGASPLNSLYPSNSIVIFDPRVTTLDKIPNGSDIIYRRSGRENEAGLRKLIKEPGADHAILVSTDASYWIQPITVTDVSIEIIGLIISITIFR
jgi:transcriptional regulator with XRE-family HTH domain